MEQLDMFNLIDTIEETEENDPCITCQRPWCYGCNKIKEN